MRYLPLSAVGILGLTLLTACSGTSSPATNGPVATPAATSGHSAPAGATVAAPSVPAASAPLITAPPAGTPVAVGDACSLLSPADLKTATGKTYLAGTLDSASGDCNWDTDASGVNSGDLIIVYFTAQPLTFIKQAYGSGGADATVGGHAAFWNPTYGYDSLWVDVGGGNLLVIGMPRSSPLTADDETTAQALAEVALSHM